MSSPFWMNNYVGSVSLYTIFNQSSDLKTAIINTNSQFFILSNLENHFPQLTEIRNEIVWGVHIWHTQSPAPVLPSAEQKWCWRFSETIKSAPPQCLMPRVKFLTYLLFTRAWRVVTLKVQMILPIEHRNGNPESLKVTKGRKYTESVMYREWSWFSRKPIILVFGGFLDIYLKSIVYAIYMNLKQKHPFLYL